MKDHNDYTLGELTQSSEQIAQLIVFYAQLFNDPKEKKNRKLWLAQLTMLVEDLNEVEKNHLTELFA